MNIKYKYERGAIIKAVQESSSIAEVLRKLNVKVTGGSHSYIRDRIRKEQIDTSHFTGSAWNQGKKVAFGPDKLAADAILVLNRLGRRENVERLRRVLLEIGVKHECKTCGLPPEWNGKPLVLEIHHKNNDPFDNRRENVEFICSNCHSQLTKEFGLLV